LESFNFFSFDGISISSFILGIVVGTFLILFFYGKFAKKIQQRTGKLTTDINLILAILTGLVAIFTVLKTTF
jgi:sulfite exporter TauE/SafE